MKPGTLWQKFGVLLDNQPLILKLYGIGAGLFFIGLGAIIYADRVLQPSVQQEVVTLTGLVLGGLGFSIAMGGQVLLILSRFKNLGE